MYSDYLCENYKSMSQSLNLSKVKHHYKTLLFSEKQNKDRTTDLVLWAQTHSSWQIVTPQLVLYTVYEDHVWITTFENRDIHKKDKLLFQIPMLTIKTVTGNSSLMKRYIEKWYLAKYAEMYFKFAFFNLWRTCKLWLGLYLTTISAYIGCCVHVHVHVYSFLATDDVVAPK